MSFAFSCRLRILLPLSLLFVHLAFVHSSFPLLLFPAEPDLSRDCSQFVRVGEPVLQIPLSIPYGDRYSHFCLSLVCYACVPVCVLACFHAPIHFPTPIHPSSPSCYLDSVRIPSSCLCSWPSTHLEMIQCMRTLTDTRNSINAQFGAFTRGSNLNNYSENLHPCVRMLTQLQSIFVHHGGADQFRCL